MILLCNIHKNSFCIHISIAVFYFIFLVIPRLSIRKKVHLFFICESSHTILRTRMKGIPQFAEFLQIFMRKNPEKPIHLCIGKLHCTIGIKIANAYRKEVHRFLDRIPSHLLLCYPSQPDTFPDK